MKKILTIMMAVAMLAAYSSEINASASVAPQKTTQQKKGKEIKTITLSANIHCKNCAKKVQDNIAFEKGVEALEVSVEKRQVVISYNTAKTDVATLLAAMKKIGYPSTVVAQ